jgi:hypothetical protein
LATVTGSVSSSQIVAPATTAASTPMSTATLAAGPTRPSASGSAS